MAVHGGRSARSAQIAALETRRTKQHTVDAGGLRAEWRARAAEHGLDRRALTALTAAWRPRRAAQPDLVATSAAMASTDGLTAGASSFDRRDVLRGWAEAHRDGSRVAKLERLADGWLTSGAALPLEAPGARPHLGGARHTVPEVLELEHRLHLSAKTKTTAGVAQATPRPEELAGLSDEQATAVAGLTGSGGGVEVVRAAAGTGKTRMLDAARRTWEREDIRVFGCALAARAAVELESSAGIDATTVAQLRRDIQRGDGLPSGSVLVVDEAGMVGTRALAHLDDHCAATGSKLVLVGDDHQLPEIEAGGMFRRLADELGAHELRQVYRQDHEWDREALGRLRAGRVQEWADAYRQHGRVVAEPTAAGVRARLVDDWRRAASEPGVDAVMVAHRRRDVAALNDLAREAMRQDGRLEEQELEACGRRFAVGDRVLARRNDQRLGIVNGTRGVVNEIDVDRHALALQLDDGRHRSIDAVYLDRDALHHGYALTAHAAQGATVDKSFVLGSDDLYREWGYTALTRHRDQATFYLVSPGSVERALPDLRPEHDQLGNDITTALQGSRRQHTAEELLEGGALGRAAADALERAARLDQERDALRPWQRRRAKELTRLADAHREEVEYWRARETADTKPASTSDRATREPVLGRGAARSALLDPPDEVREHIGSRPTGLAERELWLAAAHRLISDPQLTIEVATDLDLDHDHDTGMDL